MFLKRKVMKALDEFEDRDDLLAQLHGSSRDITNREVGFDQDTFIVWFLKQPRISRLTNA